MVTSAAQIIFPLVTDPQDLTYGHLPTMTAGARIHAKQYLQWYGMQYKDAVLS